MQYLQRFDRMVVGPFHGRTLAPLHHTTSLIRGLPDIFLSRQVDRLVETNVVIGIIDMIKTHRWNAYMTHGTAQIPPSKSTASMYDAYTSFDMYTSTTDVGYQTSMVVFSIISYLHPIFQFLGGLTVGFPSLDPSNIFTSSLFPHMPTLGPFTSTMVHHYIGYIYNYCSPADYDSGHIK